MKIAEQKDPCRRTALLMTTLGLLGGTLGFFGGVVGAAKLVGRRHPPTR